MLSFRKLYLLPILFLSACGFEPLYADRRSVQLGDNGESVETSIINEMAKIRIQPIPDRFGQLLRNELIDLLTPRGMPSHPTYTLHVSLVSRTETDQALRSDITATRKMVRYHVRYYMMEGGTRVLTGDSVSFQSFDVLANPYSTTMAARRGSADAARIIANDISLRLGAYFHNRLTNQGSLDDFQADTD